MMTYTELKEEAKSLGLEIKGNPKKEELEELIRIAKEEALFAAKEATYEKPVVTEEAKKAPAKADVRKEAMKMSKVIITPLDERMREMPSEMYSVGNSKAGFIKKVVRFNEPTWEPQIILDMLKEKTALIQQKKVVNGKEIVTKRQAAAFAIQPAELTDEEKAALGK